MATREPHFARYAITIVAGLAIWAAHLGTVYAWTAVACARHLDDWTVAGLSGVRLVIGAVTLAALAGVGALTIAAGRRRTGRDDAAERFAATLAVLIGGLSLVAIAWGGLPALVVSRPCGP